MPLEKLPHSRNQVNPFVGKKVETLRQFFVFAVDAQVLAHDVNRAAFEHAEAAAHPQPRVPKVLLPDGDTELFGQIFEVLVKFFGFHGGFWDSLGRMDPITLANPRYCVIFSPN
jgi:hypothetical protein